MLSNYDESGGSGEDEDGQMTHRLPIDSDYDDSDMEDGQISPKDLNMKNEKK